MIFEGAYSVLVFVILIIFSDLAAEDIIEYVCESPSLSRRRKDFAPLPEPLQANVDAILLPEEAESNELIHMTQSAKTNKPELAKFFQPSRFFKAWSRSEHVICFLCNFHCT